MAVLRVNPKEMEGLVRNRLNTHKAMAEKKQAQMRLDTFNKEVDNELKLDTMKSDEKHVLKSSNTASEFNFGGSL